MKLYKVIHRRKPNIDVEKSKTKKLERKTQPTNQTKPVFRSMCLLNTLWEYFNKAVYLHPGEAHPLSTEDKPTSWAHCI